MKEPFTDVTKKHWAYDAIVWAYNEGIIKGYDGKTFGPDDSVSRAQTVTMLYRFAGSPSVKGSLSDYKDSKDIGKSYKNAVIWASKNKIVNGYPDGTFRPNEMMTRAQLAAVLTRYCQNNK